MTVGMVRHLQLALKVAGADIRDLRSKNAQLADAIHEKSQAIRVLSDKAGQLESALMSRTRDVLFLARRLRQVGVDGVNLTSDEVTSLDGLLVKHETVIQEQAPAGKVLAFEGGL